MVEKILWSRKWKLHPIFLPGKSHGQRNLVGYSPWGRKELDTTEHTHAVEGLKSKLNSLNFMNSRKLVKITDKSSGIYYHLCLIEFIHGMGSFLCPPNTLSAKKQIVIYKVFCVLFTWKTQ